jgi:glycosyltransferase involved in cell wall biosynthesis
MMAIPPGNSPKVVFVNRYFHPDQSATSQLLTDLSRALSRAGFDVHVVCSRQRYDAPHANLPARESVDGVTVRRVWSSRFGRGNLLGRAIDYATFYCSGGFAMLRLLRSGDTLVAKTDPPLLSIVAMAAVRFKGAQLINWLQDIFPEVASVLGANPLPRRLDALLRRIRDRSLLAAQCNVVLGERMRERLLEMGIPRSKIKIIENWAEVDTVPPKAVADSDLRSRQDLSDKFVVGYSGNLGRAHDFATLLEAAAILRDDADVVFLMTGGGAGMTQLAQAVDERQLKNFRFLPYQRRESLADTLAAADVHWVSLMPALEGLIVPSKFYGILAAARPVVFIGDREGEIAREIQACGCGATVGIAQASELARLLTGWKRDPEQCYRMGRRGHQCYQERFGAARAFALWTEMLTPSSRVAGASAPAPLHR